MNFPTFFRIMKKYLANGATTPEFFRELIEMITEDDSDSFIINSGIAADKTDSSLQAYAKRDITKKMAGQIIYKISTQNMIESIESRPTETLEYLANDFSNYLNGITSDNIAKKITEFFSDYIRKRAGLTTITKTDKNRLASQSAKFKADFALFLLMETNHHCPFIGCDKPLIITKNGAALEHFEISLIDKEGDDELCNLIALCPDCYVSYQADSRKKTTITLKQVKKLLVNAQNSRQVISETKFDEGLSQVLTNLQKLKYDEYDISFNPKKLTEKVSPQNNRALYNTVKNSVVDNYLTIHKLIVNLDKQGKIDYIEIQSQMRSLYKKLKSAKHDNITIFNTIVEKLRKATMQDIYFCQMIVSYFIQKCEVLE